MGLRRRATRTVAFVVTAVLAVLPAGGAHAAGWSKPKQVAAGVGGPVGIAENARGDTVLAWAAGGTKGGIAYAYRRAGHGFSRARRVPGGAKGGDPLVAVDPAGGFALAWRAPDGAHAFLREAGRTRGTSRLLSIPGERVYLLSVAAGGPGTFAAAWSADQGQIEGVRADGRRPFGDVTEISRYESGTGPQVVFVPAGRAVVLWSTGESLTTIRSAVWPPKGAPGPPGTLATAADRGFAYLNWTAAADATGRESLLWWAAGDASDEEIGVAAGRAPSAFAPVQQLAAGRVLTDTQLAVASSGAAVAAWRSGFETVQASLRLPGAAAFGPPRAFGVPGIQRVSAAAMAPNGRCAVGWFGGGGVNVAVGTQSGFSTPTVLSRAFSPPVLAIDRRGEVTAAWLEGHGTLVAARYGT